MSANEQQTRACECCESECLLAGSASPNDPDGEWVTALVGMTEYIPKGHGRAFLCQNFSPSDYIDNYEDEHGTRYGDAWSEN